MTKTLNQIIFFPSTKIRIFFSAALGIRICFFRKKTITPPFKLNGRSLSEIDCVSVFQLDFWYFKMFLLWSITNVLWTERTMFTVAGVISIS